MIQLVLPSKVHSPLKSIFLHLLPVTSIFNENSSYDLKLSIFSPFSSILLWKKIFLKKRRIFVTMFFFHLIRNIFTFFGILLNYSEVPSILNRNTFSLVLTLFHHFEQFLVNFDNFAIFSSIAHFITILQTQATPSLQNKKPGERFKLENV